MSLLKQFQAHVQETSLFTHQDRLLLAISGGLDSVVLLDLLLQNEYRPTLAHCNFQLRGAQAIADANFVAGLANQHDLKFHQQTFATRQYATTHGISIQMAARELRYRWFEDLVLKENYECVLTAHHFDDNLETFTLNFLRGTGFKGIAGIPPMRDRYRRPLLFASRSALEAYQSAQGLAYREDESNAKDEYQRNYVRHHVLPHLYHLQPELDTIGVSNFKRFQQMRAFLETQLDALKATYSTVDEYQQQVFDRLAIEAHPQVDLLLWEWFSPYGFTAEQIRQLKVSQSGVILQAAAWEVLVTTDYWRLREKSELPDSNWSTEWPATTDHILLPGGRQIWRKEVEHDNISFPEDAGRRVYVSATSLKYPLKLRYRQPGDVFCPLGMSGSSQKLKDYFINQKVDRWQRARTPLLINGDDRIIWIIGQRLDERFKLEPNQQAICFELFPSSY